MSQTYQRISRQHSTVGRSDSHFANDIIDDSAFSDIDKSPNITKTQRIIHFVTSFLSGLLVVRFLAALFGADPSNAFVAFVYDTSRPFVIPFQNTFNLDATSGTARFELETLVAMLVYILLGFLAVRLLDSFRRDS